MALLLAVTTRPVCVIGGFFSVFLLQTEFDATLALPAEPDVGAHPLYLAAYAARLVGRAGRGWSLDGRLAKRGRTSCRRIARWFTARLA